MFGQFADKVLRVPQGLRRFYFIFGADLLCHEVLKRRRAVRRPPNDGSQFIQIEQTSSCAST